MTNAIPIRIADAVAAELNTAVAASSFQKLGWKAVRSYADWDEDYKDLDDMVVDVVYAVHRPMKDAIELISRGTINYKVSVDIAIRQRFSTADRWPTTSRLKNTSVDPLVTLLQEIHELFIADRKATALAAEPDAKWEDSDVLSWVNQRKLREGLFEGFVRIQFSLDKGI